MVVNKSVTSDYQLRYGANSKDQDSSSFTRSPGAGISKRTWSPGQAVLIKRKSLSNLHDRLDRDGDEEDYLAKALNTKPKRSGRRPAKSASIKSKNATEYPIRPSNRPMKSKSMGTTSRDYAPSAAIRKPSLTDKMIDRNNLCDSSIDTGVTSLETMESSERSRSKSPPRLRRSSRGRDRRSKSPAAHNYKSRSKSGTRIRPKSRDRSGPKMDQRDLPIELQQRLYRITDPDISIKKKVELELEFMKGTQEEKRIYLEFRNHFDRNEFLNWKAMDEQQQRDNIEARAQEEGLKEVAFQKTVERKHQMERRKKAEQKERERQAEEKARMHSLSTIANSMTEIKKQALEAATVSVARNNYEKKRYDDDIKKRVEKFRQNEGRYMTDVERALKEAMIEQEDPEEKRMILQRTWRH